MFTETPTKSEVPASVVRSHTAKGWLPLALLLTGPLLVNGISLMLAVMVYLKAAETAVPRDLLWLGFSYYLGYASCSYFASRRIPPQFAPLAVRGSLLALGALSFFLARADGFATYVVFSALNGGIIGFYFAPFQIAMGGLKPCKTVAWTIAFYNVSWGTGAAFGPFVSGWLRELGSPATATPEHLLEAVRVTAAGGSTGGGWSR
ncbi:MAG TPA: hypothetical protein VL860_01205, partial [Planctomycetota bacterium]|nr:hypothetical protein [Planctomycetota bacterium]